MPRSRSVSTTVYQADRSGDFRPRFGAPPTALVVGHVTRDRYGDEHLPGGGAWYGARTLEGLGVRTGLVTAAEEGITAGEELEGLTVMGRPARHSTNFVNEYPERGPRTQWIESVAPRLSPDMAAVDWAGVDILFLAPVFGELVPGEWTAAVHGRVVGLGLQGLLRRSGNPHPKVAGRRAVVPAQLPSTGSVLAGVDVVFLSEEEMEASGGDGLVERLRREVGIVVVTQGERGSTIHARDRTLRVGIAGARAVDPTGAGDTYSAAFLFGLARGDSPESAGRLAAAAASIVVEGRGGEGLARIGEAFGRAAGVAVESMGARGS